MNFINHAAFLSCPRKVIGIMTGTSLDAIDIALAEFSVVKGRPMAKTLAAGDFLLPDGFRAGVLNMISGRAAMAEISALNYYISGIYAEATEKFLRASGLTRAEIDAVGVHGQTVWHEPRGARFLDKEIRSTLQLGNISVIAKLCGITTVGDFRSGDMALGGQGAPLVPVFDSEFLALPDEDVIALNIGGIANITLIPAGGDKRAVRAFDTGPGNMLTDLYAESLAGMPYDEGGRMAARGRVCGALLEELKSEPFIYSDPPKSTGRELFNRDFVSNAIIRAQLESVSPEDLLATLTKFTVFCISDNIKRHGFIKGKIYVSGGGLKNDYLMELLKTELRGFTVESCETRGIDPDRKEALCFAYLAWLVLAGRSGNLPSVTGAKSESLLGLIALP